MASSAKRVAQHRASLRAQGLKPVQIWVQDSSAPGFAELARDWSLSLRDNPEETGLTTVLEAQTAGTEGWAWSEET